MIEAWKQRIRKFPENRGIGSEGKMEEIKTKVFTVQFYSEKSFTMVVSLEWYQKLQERIGK